MKSKPPFEYQTVLTEEASAIRRSLEEARMLHSDRDIDASGHQVENAVRAALERRMPGMYHFGKGHVVDHGWISSPEFDLVVADASSAPIFFTASDGSQYFPYEAVYALGEVKARYRKRDKPLHRFVEAIGNVKRELRRDLTPQSYVPGLKAKMPGVTVRGWAYRNPLFTCAVFVDSNGFDFEHVTELYDTTPWANLPNMVCFLDLGVLALFEIDKADEDEPKLGQLVTHPEFTDPSAGQHFAWILMPLGEPAVRSGANLAGLIFSLAIHLEHTVLMPPVLLHYLTNAGVLHSPEAHGKRATRPPDDRPPTPVP